MWFLDHPYADESGSIEPTEMERQLEIVEHEQRGVVPPCDSVGEPGGCDFIIRACLSPYSRSPAASRGASRSANVSQRNVLGGDTAG